MYISSIMSGIPENIMEEDTPAVYTELGWNLYEFTKELHSVSQFMQLYCYRDHRHEYFIPTNIDEFNIIRQKLYALAEHMRLVQETLENIHTNNKDK
jgi:hypothetical protein